MDVEGLCKEYRFKNGATYQGMVWKGPHGLGIRTSESGEQVFGIWRYSKNEFGILYNSEDFWGEPEEVLNQLSFKERVTMFEKD